MANSLVYISIDFGTAYSGYSVKSAAGSQNFGGYIWGQEFGTKSCKTPTCILFDKNEEFVEFGYAATKMYTEGYIQEQNGYFFEHFKMDLYRNEGIRMDLEIAAVNGGKMKAMTVIAESLRYLKDHALNRIRNCSTSVQLRESDITWVLTVPAIWDNRAKQFMREAAKQAGLVTDADRERLVIALEPEAAAVYCKKLSSDGFVGGEGSTMKLDQMPGTQYITVDCGGGTIDITVHEVCTDSSLKQVHQASGNGLGGQNIDRQLKSLLKTICGPTCWEEYENKHADELQKIMYDFASAKCAEKNKGFKFSCPYNLSETVTKCRGVNIDSLLQGVHGVSWKNGHIVISPEKFRSFFDQSLSKTVELLNDIMAKPGLHIEYMLLVGGYALSKILQDYIKEEFGSVCTILCPLQAQEAVMVGAAEFGSQPGIVKSRICPLTYGIAVAVKFDESKHKPEKMLVLSDGKIYCDDVFHRLVKRGESVDFDEPREHMFYPLTSTDTEVNFIFFCTTKDDSKYIDDWGMTKIDTLILPMTETQYDRKMHLKMKFGFTEITATAENSRGVKRNLTINFMSE